jgi:hypothetical protein
MIKKTVLTTLSFAVAIGCAAAAYALTNPGMSQGFEQKSSGFYALRGDDDHDHDDDD